MTLDLTTAEWEARLGGHVRSLRLARERTQRQLASDADISLGALRGLEAGRGSTVTTLVKTLRALDALDRLDALDPVGSVPSPIELLRRSRRQPAPRQRAPRGRT